MLTAAPSHGSRRILNAWSRTRFRLVAVVAVVFREGRVLAMRRALTKDAGAGLWETLSGRVRRGEDPLSAVEREIVEESGLEVHVDPRPVDAYAARRGETPMVVLVYRADWIAGEVQRSDEHDAHAWWTPADFSRHTTLARLATAVHRAAEGREGLGRDPRR